MALRISDWDSIKNFIDSRPNSSLHFVELNSVYELVAIDGPFQLEITLFKNSSEATDFENNYKSSANPPLGNPDVDKIDGVNRLRTDHTVTVQELLGTYVRPATWFTVDSASDGSSITVDITDDSVSVQTNITSSEAGDLDATATKVKDNLNNDSNFSSTYKATKPEGSPRVFVETLESGNTNERPDSGDFSVSTTSGASVTVAYDNIKQRSVPTALFPHPKDPTKGTFSVTGEMTVVNQSVKNYNPGYMTDSNGSSSMKVDGSTNEVEFSFEAFPNRDYVVTSVKLLAEDGNINMNRFMDKSLNNGLLFKIKTDGETVEFPDIVTTRDALQIFASEGGFYEIKANKTAQLVFAPRNPFLLKAGTDDKAAMTVRDDLSGIVSLSCSVEGYLVD